MGIAKAPWERECARQPGKVKIARCRECFNGVGGDAQSDGWDQSNPAYLNEYHPRFAGSLSG